jgi:hypothetical protein
VDYFPLIAAGFLPWMRRLDQGVQLALHIRFGITPGLTSEGVDTAFTLALGKRRFPLRHE